MTGKVIVQSREDEAVVEFENGVKVSIPKGSSMVFLGDCFDNEDCCKDESDYEPPTDVTNIDIEDICKKLKILEYQDYLNRLSCKSPCVRNSERWTYEEESYALWLHATGSNIEDIGDALLRGEFGVRDRLYEAWKLERTMGVDNLRERSIKSLMSRAEQVG